MKKNQMGAFLATMMALAMAGDPNSLFGLGESKTDVLEGIDIEKEYELIQKKKSNLSYSKRQLVITRYERIQHRDQNE